MSKVHPKFVYLIAISLLIMLLIFVQRGTRKIPAQESSLQGIPFEVLDEENSQSLSISIWTVRIFLPQNYYSKEDLDRLFRYCLNRYPSKQDELKVYVYTNKANYKLERETPPEPGQVFSSIPRPRKVSYDASFYKSVHRPPNGQINEWYYYKPDLSHPSEEKTVVIKGASPFVKEEPIKVWETARKSFKVRMSLYDLKNVEPVSNYLTFESFDKEYAIWGEIMTAWHNGQIVKPDEQIHFINEKTAYVYGGCMYAVSLDGGRNWSVWDAEIDLQCQHCCENDLIKEIQILADGTGIMSLTQNGEFSLGEKELYTKDYGVHWSRSR